MFGRVEGSKQVTGDALAPLQARDTVFREKFLFDYSSSGVGDELTISGTSAKVTPKGTNDEAVLEQAPSAMVKVAGKVEVARIVVDLEKNYLYTYDENGKPQMAYLIASGKPTTPTDKGLRKITHFEEYPYKTAYGTIRKQKPDAFGPRVMYLEIVDQNTGELHPSNGEFIHGNNDESSLGKYVSGGCMRMDNEVVKELVDSGQIPRGSYVLIQ